MSNSSLISTSWFLNRDITILFFSIICNFTIYSPTSFPPYFLLPNLASCFYAQTRKRAWDPMRRDHTTTNSNKRPFCDGYDIAGNRNAISRAIYASVIPNTNGMWIYPTSWLHGGKLYRCRMCRRARKHCQWRSNLPTTYCSSKNNFIVQ